MKCSVSLRAIAALLFLSPEIDAQTPAAAAASDRVVYDAAFYAPFAPSTALDMVTQTPGFVLSNDGEDDEQRRGFSGAVGNVLIDGERLSAKSQTLTDVLSRVSAAEVVRIEILRGSEVAGDASGAAVLANVVRTRTAGNGTWSLATETTNRGIPAPEGRVGYSGRNDDTEYSVGGNFYTHVHDNLHERETYDADDNLFLRSRGAIPHDQGEYAINGQLATRVAGGRLTFTGQASYSRNHENLSLVSTDPAGESISEESNPYSEQSRGGEAGVSFQRAMNDWDMELNALVTRNRFRGRGRSSYLDAVEGSQSEFVQTLRQRSGESIVRGTFTRALEKGRLEIGGEVAVNTLDGSQLLSEDTGSGPVPIIVPNGNLSVEEKRGEAFVSHALQLDDRWSLDSRLAAETSRLSFTGDTDQSVSLTYVKPRVQLTRKFGQHQLQMRAFRDVGQLDFTDFVSTAELADNVINGGNPDLKPQVAWAAEVDADLRFSDKAALRVRLFHHWLEDVVDLIPSGPPGEQIDAPGNIDHGRLTGAEIALQLPLASIIQGGLLTLNGTWQDSDVRDPLTFEHRSITGLVERKIRVDFRQDLNASRLAWGLSFGGQSSERAYRINEILRYRGLRSLDAFVETTAIAGLKIRAGVLSVLADHEERERSFFEPDRNGVLSRREMGEYFPGRFWQLSVSGNL